MIDTQHIRIDEFNYPLPEERIAKFPLDQRDHSKLLVYNKGAVGEDVFYNLPNYIDKSALMVFNNTKVIQARLHFYKETGACIEVFLLEPANPADYEQAFQTRGHCVWKCLIGNQKKWKSGPLIMQYTIDGNEYTFQVEKENSGESSENTFSFSWTSDHSFSEIIDVVGELPIPPYLNRKTEESDKRTYQTVYSKIQGSVAAPTAGLHFTDSVLEALDEKGVIRDEVTLHVGAGTFKPVKSDEIAGHEMHSETFCVKRQTLVRLLEHDCHAVAVGTTSVRTLESLYYLGLKVIANPNIQPEEMHVSQWEPYSLTTDQSPEGKASIQALLDYLDRNNLSSLHASTQIIIAPGYEYKIVNRLVTNFHQPKSTLLLLVSAFVKGDWKSIYNYALTHDFRFLSYGDSSILII